MILEHEIPQGSKLYFGTSAALKREIERKTAAIFVKHGFEEIVSPIFSYLQHQDVDINNRELLKLSNEHNFTIALRNDSTLDVARIINKRLGRSTDHKRWFYMQPVFSYPTAESYQIGAEHLDADDIKKSCDLLIEVLKELELSPFLQLSNKELPLLISQETGLSLDIFKNSKLDRILSCEHAWLKKLLNVSSADELLNLRSELPNSLQEAVAKLADLAKSLDYAHTLVSPLFYPPMEYYSDLFFRMFSHNKLIAMGGKYESEDIKSSGFAIYTDSVIDIFSKNS